MKVIPTPGTELQIDELLGRMSLDEKVGQMVQLKIRFPEQIDEICELARQGRIGSIIMKLRDADTLNTVQKAAAEEGPNGIPLLFAADVLHGFRTCFPVCVAEASSWNAELIERTSRATAAEAVATGMHWTFSPMIDVARDSRWGRQVEGAGEDPLLGSRIAAARIRGLQTVFEDSTRLAACPKHFVAYGEAQAGIDYNTVEVADATLRDIYLPPFRAALDEGAPTLMSSFNEVNGTPVTANHYLLRELLRDELGFDGMVVSDYDAVAELVPFGLARDRAEAAVLAVRAGIDMDMGSRVYLEELANAVRDGRVEEELIDQAVRRILRVKFWTGVFDRPYVDGERAKSVVLCDEHRELAREAARQSIVLLKNEGNLLPLKKSEKVAVIGPFADKPDECLGRWACDARDEDVTTILQGIKAKVGDAQVAHTRGCWLTDEVPLEVDDDEFAAKGDGGRHFASDKQYRVDESIRKAVDLAKGSDVAVLVLGQIMRATGEGSYCHSFDLPSHQQRLLEEVVATGTPTVLVLVSGRVLSVRWARDNVPAIVQAWELGTEMGNGVADVLFGDFNPCGKLPITAGMHSSKEPGYYNHKRTGRPKMRYFDYLYPFGYGLSYTSYEYANLTLSRAEIGMDEDLVVSVDVTNSGACAGAEVVQLYLRDEHASMTRPVKMLRGFERIELEPGATETVEFRLDKAALGFHDNDKGFRIEPGRFTVWVGPHSEEGLEATFELKG